MAGSGGSTRVPGGGRFPTTNRPLVESAGRGSPRAISVLAELYWFPVYSWLRWTGRSRHDAKDLTQGFFLMAIETGLFRKADPGRGRFRTFLLSCLNHFLANEYESAQTAKRGGGLTIENLDVVMAERMLGPAPSEDPEGAFHRRWQAGVLTRAVAKLKKKLSADALEALTLVLEGRAASFVDIGTRLGMDDDAVRMMLVRSRDRLLKLIKAELGAAMPAQEAEEEAKEILTNLGNRQ